MHSPVIIAFFRSVEFTALLTATNVLDQKYGLILIYLQVIEHVANPLEFCKSLSALTVPNGANVISTINR